MQLVSSGSQEAEGSEFTTKAAIPLLQASDPRAEVSGCTKEGAAGTDHHIQQLGTEPQLCPQQCCRPHNSVSAGASCRSQLPSQRT
jgi:hypothetical protein